MSETSHANHNPRHMSIWPIVITLGLALVFWGIAAYLLGVGLPLLILALIILVGGILGYLKETMQGNFVAIEEQRGSQWPFESISKLKLGVWVFIAGDIMLFGLMVGVDIYLRLGAVSWPDAGTVFSISHGALMTYLLLASTLTFGYGVISVRNGSSKGLITGLILTLILGAGFLVIKLLEWSELFSHGFNLSSGLAASTYFFTTGLHGLHVLIGIVGLAYFILGAILGNVTKEKHETLILFGIYWIFVDIVWLFIFPIMYLW